MSKAIIVGGVAGGATAASQLRRIDPDIDITIYDKGRDISFGNCGLPYHIGGEVSRREKLIAATPESLAKKNIEVYTHHEVVSVDTDKNTIVVKDSEENHEFEDSYDHLILSPGGAARTIPTLLDVPEAFVLHTLEDMDVIETHIKMTDIKKAVVVGAGYIGLEMIENLVERGMDVTFIHRRESIYATLEEDLSGFFAEAMEARGITVKLNTEIVEVKDGIATLTNGEEIETPMIIAGLGITPQTGFLAGSGIEITEAGLIPVDKHGRTNVDNVFALGDVIETDYQHVDRKTNVALAWGAHRMAFVISHQISGDKSVSFEGLLGTNIMRFFEYDIATLGLSEKEVSEYDHFIVDHKQRYKAGYMNGSEPLYVRVYVGQSDGKILRASVVGTEGVDKRIDILAAHIRLGGTAMDLANVEVAYSPPYSSPKSVLNMVGYKTIEKMTKLNG